MSKMSELDLIAQGVADHVKEIIEDSVDWQLADQPLDGDYYQDMKEYVINVAINKLRRSGATFAEITNKIRTPDDNNNVTNKK